VQIHADKLEWLMTSDALHGYAGDLYDAWSAARDESSAAYAAWCGAPQALKAEGHAVYVAAADREAAAIDVYMRAATATAFVHGTTRTEAFGAQRPAWYN
jgi:hypothetical protein